jgi:hypothetical protein
VVLFFDEPICHEALFTALAFGRRERIDWDRNVLSLLDGGDRRVDSDLYLRQGDLALVTIREETAIVRSLLVLSIVSLLWSTCVNARDEEQQHGKELLQSLCARCHSVGRTGASPTGRRRPSAALAKPNSTTATSCNDYRMAIAASHPSMPTFRFNRDDAEAVLNYMKSIQEQPKPKQSPQ